MPEYNDPQKNVLVQSPKKQPKSETVKDAVSKGKTATGSKQDQIILNPVLEEKEKHAVFAFGRFNPPTTGHEKLIHKVEDTAKSVGGQAHIIASHSEGTGKNPLPKEKKVGYLKKVANKDTHVSSSSSEHPTLLHQLSNLHKTGVQHLTMVAGSDRVKEYHDLLHKYNGQEGKHGHYNFKSINVVSAGHRDPDAEGAEGMSGTKMREHARSGNMKAFKSGLPKALHPHAKEIADHIKSVKEDIDDVFDMFIIETAVEEIGSIYDQVIAEAYDEDKENAKIKKINHANTHFRDDATSTRTMLYKHDTPGEPKTSKVKEDVNNAFESWVNDENPDPKHREVVNRHGQDRKKIQLVPRDKKDRKEDDRPYRHQEIQKKIIDEKYGKGYKSPWQKIMAAAPKGTEERINKSIEGLKKNAADYQAILDKEKEKKKVSESINSAGGGSVRGMGYNTGNPDGVSDGYIGQNIANADTQDNILKAQVKAHVDLHNTKTADKSDKGKVTAKEDLNLAFKQLTEDSTTEKDPVKQLEDKLNTATDKSYEGIDKLMRQVAKDCNMDVHDLHDMWVEKTGITPDQYVKEAVWDEPAPKGKHGKMTPAQVAKAKARARAAGRPYPNLVDNMAAMKEETLDEISNELIGKVNKLRSLGPDIVKGVKPTPHKTSAGAETLYRAVEKVRKSSEVGKVKDK
jgi:hypothetical protein